jgi:predicted GNAT family acetyltransferase
LNNPETYILRPGGALLMATQDGIAIGTCALLAMGDGSLEVAKMTVGETHRGLGLGERLLAFVIESARGMGARRLYLETNSGLQNAIHVIDREVYDNVQNVIAGRRTRGPGRRVSGAGITWILRGILRCGSCDRLMSTHTVRSGPVIHGYDRCRSTSGGREACKGVMIPAYEIETAVLSEIGPN